MKTRVLASLAATGTLLLASVAMAVTTTPAAAVAMPTASPSSSLPSPPPIDMASPVAYSVSDGFISKGRLAGGLPLGPTYITSSTFFTEPLELLLDQTTG